VVPRQPFLSLNALAQANASLAGHLLVVVQQIAMAEGLEKGYRVVINTGPHGGQTVNHVHIHLLGGRPLGWPPG